MPIQHLYPPQHLALAIALALGCADISLAQHHDNAPTPTETTAEWQARLKAFAKATDTDEFKVKKTYNGAKGVALQMGDSNDLVIVSGRGKLIGLVEGGGGINVLQLDIAKGGKLQEIRNFQDLDVRQGEWSITGNVDGKSLIDSTAKLINTGHIGGEMRILGGLDNQGVVANTVTLEPGASMANSGTVNGSVYVRESASFSGNGTVDFLSVAGQLEVGYEIGAPSITGNFELLNGAELIYGVNADGGSSTINVGETATLNNATLKIAAAPGEYIGTSKHIVIDADKVEGEFGTVVSDLAFMTATPNYTGTQVGLTYTRNDIPLEDAATTDNGRRFTTSIEEPQPVEPPQAKPVETATVAQAPAAAGPDIDATPPTPTELPKIASAEQKSVGQQQTTRPKAKPNTAINALLGTNRATAANAIDQLSGYDTADLANATLSSIAPISSGMLSAMGQINPGSARADGQVWVQPLGNSGSVGKQFGGGSLKHSTKGLMLGTDWAVGPDWRLGVIGGKTHTRLDSRQFDGELDSWHLGAYALRQNGPLALRLGAVYGNHDGGTKRHVAFNGFSDRLKGHYDANTQQVFGQVGYNLNIDHFDVEPYVHLGYQRYQRDRYTEKGGDAALQFNSQSQDHYSSNLGLSLARSFPLDHGMRWTPRLNVSWKHIYGDVRGNSRQRLATGGNMYTIEGVELDRDSLLLEAGLDLAVSPRHTLGVSYNGETGQDNRNSALMGQWRMMF